VQSAVRRFLKDCESCHEVDSIPSSAVCPWTVWPRQRRRCVSAKFTDPKEKPSWNGKRFRFLLKPPDRADLCEEYVALRRSNQEHGDPHATEAFNFWRDNQSILEAGAIVANPHRFNPNLLPDGRPTELSALQRYYNEVARIGQEAVSTEFDNDPPEETRVQESGITPTRIQCQVSGYPRGQIPPGCTVLSEGIDVSKTYLHWVVRAWRPDPNGFASGFTIAYGVQEVHGTVRGSDEGLDTALMRALHARRIALEEKPYTFADGTPLEVQLHLIDSKWRKEAVFRFCDEAGQSWYPAIGYRRRRRARPGPAEEARAAATGQDDGAVRHDGDDEQASEAASGKIRFRSAAAAR
jgi:hypothetical protein